MITFSDKNSATTVQDLAIEHIMHDIRFLEERGFKIIRIEVNYNLKHVLFPDQTFEDYLPKNAIYQLGTLVPEENVWEPTENPAYRIVVEEVTERREIQFV